MPTHLIRWRDPVLWPKTAALIPAGHTAQTNRADADARFLAYAEQSLTTAQREKFVEFWRTAMDTGFQRNGLVLASLNGLAAHLGYQSISPARDFGLWVQDNDLWRNVPGRLYPSTDHLPGGRYRTFIVLAGTCDHCATPHELVRNL